MASVFSVVIYLLGGAVALSRSSGQLLSLSGNCWKIAGSSVTRRSADWVVCLSVSPSVYLGPNYGKCQQSLAS